MFCIEALVIALRPLLITLPLTAAFIVFAVRASHLNLSEFLPVAPVAPIAVFSLAILGFVALAYYIGGKKFCAAAWRKRCVTIRWHRNLFNCYKFI